MRDTERICTRQGAAWFHWLCCYQLDSQQLAQPLGKSGGKQTLTPLSAVSQDPARNAKPQTSDLSQNHCIWICILTRSTIQVSSVTQSCPTFCEPMDCSMSGFPVHHQLPELLQTHVYWVGDVIQPSHPLSSPSLPAFNLSQHQGLFKWVLHIRWPVYWSCSFSISPSNEYSGLISLGWTGRISLLSKGLSRVFSNTTVQKHQLSL